MGTIEIEIDTGNDGGGTSVVASAIASTGLLNAQQPAALINLAYSNLVANTGLSQRNAVANQQAVNARGPSIVARASAGVSDPGPLQARSAIAALTDDAPARTIADLKAAVAALAPPNDAVPP